MSSDDAVHECYRDPTVIAAVIARFGEEVSDGDGGVDRARLGDRVFDDPVARRDLEAIIHPRIHAAREAWIARERGRVPPPPLLVCEVPLLFEVDLADRFDVVLVVTASDEVRRARVEARGQDFTARSAQQIPEAVKIDRADRYVVNDGSRAELAAWVADRFREFATT